MRAYLRRLWAALRGEDYVPLHVGATFSLRGPEGERVRFELTSVALARDFTGIDSLTIEGRSPVHRLQEHR